MPREYKATFVRESDWEHRYPHFSTEETDQGRLQELAYESLRRIPFLKPSDWKLVSVDNSVSPSLTKSGGREEALHILIRRILDGDYQIGEALPKVVELCEDLRATRHVIVLALEDLEALGYVQARGKGNARRKYVQVEWNWPVS